LGAVWFWFFHAIVFLVSPVVALVGAFGLSTGLSYRAEQQQKRFIQGAFVQVLSPSVLERLMKEPERLAAGGEQAELTMYFSDLAGFTKFSERLKPHELVRVLNRYLSDMVATIVDEYQGYVDKFIGDAVMAFWGAPVPDEDHAFHACAAALRNQEKLRALQPELASLGLDTEMRMRIGLHTGPAIAGMMGSVRKLNYTVMGDAVNLASRLEGVNKYYETSMLISQETQAALAGRLVTREIDLIRVKGKLAPTRIYELVAEPGRLSAGEQDFLGEYRLGLEAYWQRGFKQARVHFKHALRLKPGDFPAMMFLKRCAQYLKKAPGRRWDGVTVMEAK
jgi:adenylate cyclase